MRILVVADYPRPGKESASIFNERSVRALGDLCERIEVIAHRPYLPSVLSLVPRWRTWVIPTSHEVRNGISIHRPAFFLIPKLGNAFWHDRGAYFWCRQTVRELQSRIGFDAIVSFDLLQAGGLAWRLARDVGIPASGWACGSDLRQPKGSALERVVLRAIARLDLIFYQSRELF